MSFTPGELWPDTDGVPINAHGGGVLLHEGVYYWFGEHKVAGEIGNTAQVGVGVYRSTDLCRWENAGIALAVSSDEASPIVRGAIIERPKVLRSAATGKFVMWFHLEPKGAGYLGAMVGTAVADEPAGPYRFVRAFRPNAGHYPMNVEEGDRRPLTDAGAAALKSLDLNGGPVSAFPKNIVYRRDMAGGQMSRDMTLYQDDDGTAYHVCASEENGVLHISELRPDLLDTTGRYVRVFPGGFHEAPAIFKHKGTYYLFSSHCTGWSPNAGRVSRAPSMWGPWEELGNPCIGTDAERATTFESQSTFVLPVAGRDGAYIFMADRWRPANAIDGRYVWLPVEFDGGVPVLRWRARWELALPG